MIHTESGFSFANGGLFRWPNGSTFDSDPTPSTGLFTNYGGTTVMAQVGGNPFDLLSIDFDDVYHEGMPNGFLDYNYAVAGGGSGAGSVLVDDVPGFTTVLFNLANLSWFSFTPSAQLVYVQFDNVRVTGGVVTPIPATLPLFASALAGLAWIARRRRGDGASAAVRAG